MYMNFDLSPKLFALTPPSQVPSPQQSSTKAYKHINYQCHSIGFSNRSAKGFRENQTGSKVLTFGSLSNLGSDENLKTDICGTQTKPYTDEMRLLVDDFVHWYDEK